MKNLIKPGLVTMAAFASSGCGGGAENSGSAGAVPAAEPQPISMYQLASGTLIAAGGNTKNLNALIYRDAIYLLSRPSFAGLGTLVRSGAEYRADLEYFETGQVYGRELKTPAFVSINSNKALRLTMTIDQSGITGTYRLMDSNTITETGSVILNYRLASQAPITGVGAYDPFEFGCGVIGLSCYSRTSATIPSAASLSRGKRSSARALDRRSRN